jgi:hypothetical protein
MWCLLGLKMLYLKDKFFIQKGLAASLLAIYLPLVCNYLYLFIYKKYIVTKKNIIVQIDINQRFSCLHEYSLCLFALNFGYSRIGV